jgi:hypothetical protein
MIITNDEQVLLAGLGKPARSWDTTAHDGKSWAGLIDAADDFLQRIPRTDKWTRARADLYPLIRSFIR